jgi:hypothetical protein
VIENAAERCRDVVSREADVFSWVADAEIVDPDEKTQEGRPVIDWGVFVFLVFCSRARKLHVGGAVIRGPGSIAFDIEDCQWIDTQTPIVAGATFWGYPGDEGKEESRDESPDESREKDVVRELFLLSKLFSYVRDCLGSEGGVVVALALLDGGEAALEMTCKWDALCGESHGSIKVDGRIARGDRRGSDTVYDVKGWAPVYSPPSQRTKSP